MRFENKADVLLGLQWGDEGKGKIVDVLTPRYQLVARFQGGPNAGHTLEFENKKFILHTIPSGIFHDGCQNVIGNGVVLDPFIFKQEVESLGIGMPQLKKNLFISGKAHLILPSHRLLDAAYECSRGKQKIGSTLKGIGPAYTDKIARCGMRLAETLSPAFREKYQERKNAHMKLARNLGYNIEELRLEEMDFEAYEAAWFKGLETIWSLTQIESEIFVNQALDDGLKMLAEGAQGTQLDIDFGSYPFVTSSSTIAAGACTGLGLAPSRIGEVYGILKAYCTRVGSGPFPTELFDEEGDRLRNSGNEFGSTTGRPRRCGWLDLPALKYAVMLNGVTKLIMTKVDVLNGMKNFKVCTAYEYGDQRVDYLPSDYDPDKLKPILQTMEGWDCDLKDFKTIQELPAPLQEYLNLIEAHVGLPMEIVSTGPDRTHTLFNQ